MSIDWKKLRKFTEEAMLEDAAEMTNRADDDLVACEDFLRYAETDYRAKEYWAIALGYATFWDLMFHKSLGLRALGGLKRGVASDRSVKKFERLLKVGEKTLTKISKICGKLDKLHRKQEKEKAREECRKKKMT